MSQSQTSTHDGTMSMLFVLQILFIVFKLTGLVDWPWLWVMAPMLFQVALVVLAFTVLGLTRIFDVKE